MLTTMGHYQHLPIAILNFLKKYLPSWNGRDGREHIVKMLGYLPLLNFDG